MSEKAHNLDDPAALASWIVDFEFFGPEGRYMNRLQLTSKYAGMISTFADQQTAKILNNWADFLEDPSMNAMTPSERLRKAADALELHDS